MRRCTYILQKDLPRIKAGTMFTYDESSNMYSYTDLDGILNFIPNDWVIRNVPKWFHSYYEEEEVTITYTIKIDKLTKTFDGLCFLKENVPPFKYKKIVYAIEPFLKEEEEVEEITYNLFIDICENFIKSGDRTSYICFIKKNIPHYKYEKIRSEIENILNE